MLEWNARKSMSPQFEFYGTRGSTQSYKYWNAVSEMKPMNRRDATQATRNTIRAAAHAPPPLPPPHLALSSPTSPPSSTNNSIIRITLRFLQQLASIFLDLLSRHVLLVRSLRICYKQNSSNASRRCERQLRRDGKALQLLRVFDRLHCNSSRSRLRRTA